MHRQAGVNGCDAGGGGGIDEPPIVLRDGTDADGGELICPVHAGEGAAVHQKDAEVVGADPQSSQAVQIETAGVQDSIRGFDALKGDPIIADQAGIAADPEKTVVRLGDGVGF